MEKDCVNGSVAVQLKHSSKQRIAVEQDAPRDDMIVPEHSPRLLLPCILEPCGTLVVIFVWSPAATFVVAS